MGYTIDKKLKCDMEDDCTAPVAYVDDKGFAYCVQHGLQRKSYRPTRKLTKKEIRTLEAGETISYSRRKKVEPRDFNGWANYQTWNVSLWIQNDEGLYSWAKDFKRLGYKKFAECLKEVGGEISYRTPDGVAWNDSSLDIEALDKMLGEL